ncbi:uncharacterized protein BXIN_0326 [Babesia sp. Xinjiang]|uniref:uncharacterized protein n=1 Tax=Babesia sp. Xinjiang TaxID=462227 RepID=UPI000A2638DF|nr:uncharacterized protein BXIN_0281 [Babesia sp. Xinjiang]XP_028871597.1 uncharacterized protein BXIN_0326 [Babesia sp. Xinjiang]ORM41087.1 hypothetical protein BXIN_0281 [Babesia sp. Xinjiang]ORM41141.1 hypothetical protein BXIN_0326 [Babesia sp. Xinjiang]
MVSTLITKSTLHCNVSPKWSFICRRFAAFRKSKADLKPLRSRHMKQLEDETYDPPIPPRSVPCDATSFQRGWRPVQGEAVPGYEVPTRFRVGMHQHTSSDRKTGVSYSRDTSFAQTYTDFSGLRFPTLDTAENKEYWKDTGLNRLLPRIFPIKLPMCRKIDPLMREYIYFLHTLDPGRFTIRRIAERYGFKESTVQRVVKEFSLLNFILYNRLCDPKDRRITLEEARLQLKEQAYRDHIGYIHTANEEEDEEHEFQGFESTADWIYRQSIQVEGLSAFALPSTRDPMPKRVDVDLTVKHTKHVKVINWIDPSDKVVF